jgi:hypothetical protein
MTSASSSHRVPARAWLAVVLVGVIVELVVFGLQLYPRLRSGQDVINGAKPAFVESRVAGDRAGITMVSHIVDLSDPLVLTSGGAAGEVPRLVAFVSHRTGLSQSQVLAALRANFPHTTGLLTALPLAGVTAEVPRLLAFLQRTLHVSGPQLQSVLNAKFPHLTQAVTALPFVTDGWDNVPGTASLARFSGAPVRTVPQVRDYFADDVIPVLERQQHHFTSLSSKNGVFYLAPLLTAVGLVVILFGLLMYVRASRRELTGRQTVVGWQVVALVGVLVIVVVLALNLFARLSDGQKLLDDAHPAFVSDRVTGARAGITMVSHIVDTADPLVLRSGGGAGDVPRLVAYVSHHTGLSKAQVLAALKTNFPHITGLLTALPLSAVTGELPKLLAFLQTTLKATPAQLSAALAADFPRLDQSIAALPLVTGGWANVPGTVSLTRFSGAPVHTVPQVRDYFADDVIPVLETQHGHFATVNGDWPKLTWFAPLLTIVGVLVVLFALAMLLIGRATGAATRSRREAAQAGPLVPK